ncbi:uncharacterized protein LOC126984022 [Eriocheir sinensis]|uniref:uncharacterized protein LOC126984022 n=1 Tax=Eriocheir sinensis TaxID=95602 RepID=UPI0021C68B4A|nr:uncharacterized protein LOC126984022 [Eriocheir sinensis]
MCCTLRSVVAFGIILAVIDIMHGLVTAGFYCYQFVMDTFYLCPLEMEVTLCHNKIYVYEQLFETRVYIGIGEGIAGVIFAVFYILALVKHKPSMTWVWLMKSFAVISINVYYLASWLIRRGRYDHINIEQPEDEKIFIYAAKGLTLVQILIMMVFCLIGAIFTYKVCEERTASRRNLRHRRKWESNEATAPPLGQYEDEEAQYLNDALTNSEKTLPARSSKQSLTEISRADTFKHSTGV